MRLLISLLAIGGIYAAELKPFALDHRNADRSSLDLSFLLDAPAGKSGFVHIVNGHLVTGDGKRLRLWGVNVTDWSRGSVMLPPKEDAPMWAATLARFGVNCVRLHFLDLAAPRGIIDNTKEDTRSFDKDQLDRLDFWIAELKKRGVYIDLNLNVGRSYKPGDGVQDADKIRWGKGLTFYDPRLIELQKEYAKALLTHKNPYTGIEYRAEPAIAIVEICNENAIYLGFRAPTPYYEKELLDLYNAWRARKQLPPVEARLGGRDTAAAPQERYDLELQFFNELERGFFDDMKAYLRTTLGVKAPIIGTADHSHSGSSYPLLRAASTLDIVDGHTYWQHPGAGPHNTPMVNDPLKSAVIELSRTAFAGKPYTVSETNHPFPSEYASEGIPILAAYAALQDWDGIFWYTFEPKRADWQPVIGDPFDISHDPVKMPELAASALLFVRGDVAAAKKTIERSYSHEQVNASARLARTEAPYFTPGFPLSIPLRDGVRIKTLDGAPTAKIDAETLPPFASDTGELNWNTGIVTVDTARSQAQIGFLKEKAKPLTHLATQIDNNFASVILSALDAQPIAQSRRMLLTAGAFAANSGATWNEARNTLAQWGVSPTVVEPVTGHITLRNLKGARRVTISALNGSGRPIGKSTAAEKSADGWRFAIGDPVTTWYEILVEK